MHKKEACPLCKGKGFVRHPHVFLHPNYHVEFLKETCPKCHGARYYLRPATNLDILVKVPQSQGLHALAEVAVDAMTESLINVHGAVLNQAQKDYIRDFVERKFTEFLKENADLMQPCWPSPLTLDVNDFIPSLEDIMNFNGVE